MISIDFLMQDDVVVKNLYTTKYKDIYVTEQGEVYSWIGKKPVLCLKYIDNGTGYYRVGIEGKFVYVHRLMAETFLDNPNGLPEVNHLDGNPFNNALYNLQWCNRKENVRHAQRLKKMKKACGDRYLKCK